MSEMKAAFQFLPCGCTAELCDTDYWRVEIVNSACPKRHKKDELTTQVYILEHTVTERYSYDPVALAERYGVTTTQEVIELFEKHDGSAFCDELFYNDANPSVGVELVTRWDDD